MTQPLSVKQYDSGDDLPFEKIADRYKLVELLGRGSSGNVYKAIDTNFGKIVAVKILHAHVLKDEDSLKRFRREARILSSLSSNNIIKVLDADVSPQPYLVTEYFEGIPLDQWIKNHGAMKPLMVLELFLQLCRGLAEAEAMNLIHRDLKPANILLRTYGEVLLEAKIVDFGFVKCLDQDSTSGGKITATGEILGTPAYMSPEQFKGDCDQRSDIYSLGCIMYEMLSGRPAFKGRNAFDYFHKHMTASVQRIFGDDSDRLNLQLESVILKCLEKSKHFRYQSAEYCRRDLKKIQQAGNKHDKASGIFQQAARMMANSRFNFFA